MKKLIALVLFVALASVGSAQTVSTSNLEYPLPVQTRTLTECPNPASATIESSYVLTLSGTAQRFPAMPAGTKTVIADCINGVALYGNASISTGVAYSAPTIGSGAEVIFDVSSMKGSRPVIYFIQSTTGAGGTLRFTPFK
jgi:hypothetical protein